MRAAAAVLTFLLAAGAWAQGPGAPVDVDDLLRRARAQAVINARLSHDYSFREAVVDESLDDKGAVIHSERSLYRVFPFPDGTERQLLEKDGGAPPPRLVRKQQARNEKVRRHAQAQGERERRVEQERARKAAKAAGQPPPRAAPPPAPARAPTPTPTPRALPPPPPRPEPLPVLEASSLPDCDPDAPASRVAPPAPGSRIRSTQPARIASAQARRSRESASDYTLFELLSLTAYEYAGSCRFEGRPVHVVSFRPPDGFDPANPVERVMTGMAGTILIDAAETQVVRAESRTVAPLKWGGGLVTLKHAHVVFENRKVNDEVWLPSRDLFEFDSRVLVAGTRERTTNVYDDYKKIAVTTSEEIQGVVPPGARAE